MLTAYSNRPSHGKEKECAVLHMERAGVPQDMVKAYTWFRKAASYDHEDALRYLSSLPPPRQAVVFNSPINHTQENAPALPCVIPCMLD